METLRYKNKPIGYIVIDNEIYYKLKDILYIWRIEKPKQFLVENYAMLIRVTQNKITGTSQKYIIRIISHSNITEFINKLNIKNGNDFIEFIEKQDKDKLIKKYVEYNDYIYSDEIIK